MQRIKLLVAAFVLQGMILVAQNTIGLLSYQPDKTFDGYNLLYPHNQPNVYLLNNCGEIVHTWTDDPGFRPGNTAYLTQEGLLYKAKRPSAVANDPIWAGGGGAILEIRDWDNTLLWDFEMNDEQYRLHHDFAITPDGTIIALAWELKTQQECLDAGRDISTLAQGELWPDWIFEIDPDTDQIIWEWHTWDHLVQDFDDTKPNYGVVADHPELIDVNFGRPDGHPDWMHANAIDYNAILDQVMLSVPYFNEIWIIDHSTTTEQAAGHTGGLSGRGGDLMFRWGNPITYDSGDSTDQQLFFQHDAHWVDDFLDQAHPYYGDVGVFNNRVATDYSSVHALRPAWDMYDWGYALDGNLFLPEGFVFTATHPTPTELWSTGLSSIRFLPNGNTLITAGRFGYSFELTPDNEVVWEYKTPLNGGMPATQGDMLEINNNLTFRMDRYPSDFIAFDGKDLSHKGWIELQPDSTFCNELTSVMDPMNEDRFRVYPNPITRFITIEWDGMFFADIDVFNALGQRVATHYGCSGGRKYVETSGWESGVYWITIDGRYSRKVVK